MAYRDNAFSRQHVRWRHEISPQVEWVGGDRLGTRLGKEFMVGLLFVEETKIRKSEIIYSFQTVLLACLISSPPSWTLLLSKHECIIDKYNYNPTVLVIVRKARETSTSIPRYCTVGYCTVPCARSSCYTCSFLSSYWKKLEKVKLDNKSIIRCFGVKYRQVFLLVDCILTRPAGSSKYSTTRKNVRRYFTPKPTKIYLPHHRTQF